MTKHDPAAASGAGDAADFTSIPELSPQVFTAPLRKPVHVGADWLEPAQREYTEDEHEIWNVLYDRQEDVLPGRACTAFLGGLKRLRLDRGGVPDFSMLNRELQPLTGWSVVPVPMLIPDHVFFYHLANRRFPAGNFIRGRDCFDYIEAPDVFHDVFGHVPLLTDPVFGDYMQAYGRAGWKALRYNRLKALGALYWYTVEFGLVNEPDGIRAYGAGILSSSVESRFAIDARSPNRIHLAVDRVMRTDYQISDLQRTYFIVDDFQELFKMTEGRGFDPIYETLEPSFKYAASAILDTDHVYHRGSQEYALRGGRGSNAEPV